MAGGRYALGVVWFAFAPLPAAEASVRASELGFEFIDPVVGTDPSTLKLPVGCPASDPTPVPGWGFCPRRGTGPVGGRQRWSSSAPRPVA